MIEDFTQKAIDAALSRDWKTAIDLNTKIIKQDPKDVDAHNRLGRAFFETGQKTKAELTYKKALKLDKFNSIAAKSLELLKNSKITRSGGPAPTGFTTQAAFIEEPGITKTVVLTRLGDPKVIAALHPGDPVQIMPREHCIAVVTTNNLNLGRLPDDLAARMMNLIKNGNKYEAWVRSIEPLKVFMKEIYKSPKNRSMISFPLTEKLTYAAFTPPELIHKELPDTKLTEEQDDVDIITEDDDMEEMSETPMAE